MKVTGVRTVLVELPLEQPVKTAIHDIRTIGYVLVFVDTDTGVTGESYLFSLSGRHLGVLDAMVKSLGAEIVGEDPRFVEAIWHKMWRGLNFFGHAGISLFGLSALDMALWDARGKAAGQSIASMVGACRTDAPAYASGGLWLSATADELVAEAKGFVEQGFRAMKMRLGKPRLDDDIDRVAAVRDAIGDDVALMVDANQGLTVDHAIRLGRELEEFDLVWFEEPVAAYDLAGHAAVAAALDTPVASGETEYARYGFRRMIEAKAADILMPDLARVGGVTEFLRVAHMAQAWDITVSPHIFTEQSLQILGAVDNGTWLEHMPWFGALYREKLEMNAGRVAIPDRPGFGFTFDPDAVDRFRTSAERPDVTVSVPTASKPAAPTKPAAPAKQGGDTAPLPVSPAEPGNNERAPRRKPAAKQEGKTPWYLRARQK